MADDPLIIAVPKGRILTELRGVFHKMGLIGADGWDDEDSRLLRFPTNIPGVELVRVRPFDVATFVAFGAAHLGVTGADVLLEFDYPGLYAPLDLRIGPCRLSVAERAELTHGDDPRRWSRVRVATKYPNLTQRYFAGRGVQAEIIKLNGAVELAPVLGMARYIVDLVSSGATLRANGLVEIERIAEVTSRLLVNRAAAKTDPDRITHWIDRFRAAVAHAEAA